MKKILLILVFTLNLFGDVLGLNKISLKDVITKIGKECINPSTISFFGEFSPSSDNDNKEKSIQFYQYEDGSMYNCFDNEMEGVNIGNGYQGKLPYGLKFEFNKEQIIELIGKPDTYTNNGTLRYQTLGIDIWYDFDNKNISNVNINRNIYKPIIHTIDAKINKDNLDYLVLKIKASSLNKLNKLEYIVEPWINTTTKNKIKNHKKIDGRLFHDSFKINISSLPDGTYEVKVKVIDTNLNSSVLKTVKFDKKSHNFLSEYISYGSLCFDKEDYLETWTLGLLKHKKCRVNILEVYNEKYKVEAINRVSACPKDKEFIIESKLLCEYQEKKGLK